VEIFKICKNFNFFFQKNVQACKQGSIKFLFVVAQGKKMIQVPVVVRQQILAFLCPQEVCLFRRTSRVFASDCAAWTSLDLKNDYHFVLNICAPRRAAKILITGETAGSGTALAHVSKVCDPVKIDLRESRIQNSALVFLFHMHSLQILRLVKCQNITNAALFHIGKLASLRVLELKACCITDAGLPRLLPLKLCTISLGHTDLITSAGLLTVAKMGVEKLILNKCSEITDSGLECLSTLDLNHVGLFGNPQLTDIGLKNLSSSTVKILNLGHCSGFSAAGMAHVARMTDLIWLRLYNCAWVTDVALFHVAKLVNLKYLDLQGCINTTEVGLVYLNDMPNLNEVHLEGCTRISRQWLAACFAKTFFV